MNKSIPFLLMLLCLLVAQPLHAQKKKSNKKNKNATGNTSYSARMKNEPAAAKEYMHLYRTNTRGTLLGNKCMEDYTEKMGFRYVMMPPDQDGSLTATEMRFHNFGVKFALLLKNGPFWHHRLNKQVKKCREKTGDFYG
ncbi:hypothetical protein [Cesiribacter sp. SM1]|uniref:hypothetical protein n=1 Tax=Cesiribacter sp. SM1 TaxID=2861196 RepID=UPI001CD332EA|nr:hypothetical protein [Cesiribacter sp. SM1]